LRSMQAENRRSTCLTVCQKYSEEAILLPDPLPEPPGPLDADPEPTAADTEVAIDSQTAAVAPALVAEKSEQEPQEEGAAPATTDSPQKGPALAAKGEQEELLEASVDSLLAAVDAGVYEDEDSDVSL